MMMSIDGWGDGGVTVQATNPPSRPGVVEPCSPRRRSAAATTRQVSASMCVRENWLSGRPALSRMAT